MQSFIQLFENRPQVDKDDSSLAERAGDLSPEYYERLRHMAWDGKLTYEDIRSLKGHVEFNELLQIIKGIK